MMSNYCAERFVYDGLTEKYIPSNVLANNDDTPVSRRRARGIAVKDERFQKKKRGGETNGDPPE